MFWDSIVAALKMFSYWETYVAGLEYLAIYIIPMLVLSRFTGKGGLSLRYISMLLIPATQVAALIMLIFTLATLIFGFTNEASWDFPWRVVMMAPMAFVMLVAVLIIVSFVFSLIPVLGRFHSLQTLILGGLSLVFVLSMFDSVNPGQVRVDVNFIPGLWFTLGIIVIGGFLSWLGTIVSDLIVSRVGFSNARTGQIIMIPISAVFGFIPLFIYGAWLGAQVKGGF